MGRKKQKKKQLVATLLLVICTLFCYGCSMLGIIANTSYDNVGRRGRPIFCGKSPASENVLAQDFISGRKNSDKLK